METAREREGGKEWSKIASEVLSWPEPGEGIIYKYAMRVDGNGSSCVRWLSRKWKRKEEKWEL